MSIFLTLTIRKCIKYSILLLLCFFTMHIYGIAQNHSNDFNSSSKILVIQRKWPELEALSRERINISPNDSKVWEILAISLGNQNRMIESIEAFQKAFSLDKNSSTICMNLAISYAKNKDNKNLIELLKEIDTIHPEYILGILDRDEIFNIASLDNIQPMPENRKSKVIFPLMGEYPPIKIGKIINPSVMFGGYVIFEAFISSDGLVIKSKGLTGKRSLWLAAQRLVDKLKFPKLEHLEDKTIQRIKVVVNFDRGYNDDDKSKHLKIQKIGIGFSVSESERRAVDVPSVLEYRP